MKSGERFGWVLAASSVFFATHANAQNVDGSFRLGLEGNVLALDHVTLASGPSSVSSAGTTLGLPGSALGLALGYGASTNVLLGARFLASSIHNKVGDAAADATSFALFPQVEYIIPGTLIRPVVSANVGFRATGSSGGVDTSTSTFLIGPGAGMHAFVSSSFSIDTGLMALFQKGTVKSDSVEVDTSGYSVLLTVGLSGWLGGGHAASAAAPPLPPPGKPPAIEEGSIVVDEAGAIDSTFTLDRPNTSGGVRVTIQGDPDRAPNSIQIIVTFLKPPQQSAPCGPLAFEAAGKRTELTDMRSSSRGGFGSALSTQAGTLPLDALGSLTDTDRETWLMLCDERVLPLPAAKRRMERFMRVFRRRLPADRP